MVIYFEFIWVDLEASDLSTKRVLIETSIVRGHPGNIEYHVRSHKEWAAYCPTYAVIHP